MSAELIIGGSITGVTGIIIAIIRVFAKTKGICENKLEIEKVKEKMNSDSRDMVKAINEVKLLTSELAVEVRLSNKTLFEFNLQTKKSLDEMTKEIYKRREERNNG